MRSVDVDFYADNAEWYAALVAPGRAATEGALRRLAGEDMQPKKRFGLGSAGKDDDTILAASPSRSRATLRSRSSPRSGPTMSLKRENCST